MAILYVSNREVYNPGLMMRYYLLSSLLLTTLCCTASDFPPEDNGPEINYTDETAGRDTRTKRRYENQNDPGYRNRSYSKRNAEDRNAYMQGQNQFPQQAQYDTYNTYGSPAYPSNSYSTYPQ